MRSVRIIAALVGKQLRILSRMPAILLVIFLPGIVMYAVFTKIFEGPSSSGGGSGVTFKLGVLDLDESYASKALVSALEDAGVRVQTVDPTSAPAGQAPEDFAKRWVLRKGHADSALVIPEGFHASPVVFMGDHHDGVRLIYDESSPIQAQAIEGTCSRNSSRSPMSSYPTRTNKVPPSGTGSQLPARLGPWPSPGGVAQGYQSPIAPRPGRSAAAPC